MFPLSAGKITSSSSSLSSISAILWSLCRVSPWHLCTSQGEHDCDDEETDYDRKIEEMLRTGIYGKLRGDFTATQNRLSHKLKRLENNREITNTLCNKLRPTHSQPPRIYGLLKIHRPDVPLRSIVSCIGSPIYQLSKHITSLISPLAGHTSSHFKNSRHFT